MSACFNLVAQLLLLSCKDWCKGVIGRLSKKSWTSYPKSYFRLRAVQHTSKFVFEIDAIAERSRRGRG